MSRVDLNSASLAVAAGSMAIHKVYGFSRILINWHCPLGLILWICSDPVVICSNSSEQVLRAYLAYAAVVGSSLHNSGYAISVKRNIKLWSLSSTSHSSSGPLEGEC
ncbi:unnamed protein product [Protopolystoma xenopodis]|uniref:Uncharacterized protein n=1 Tax=Protopolystoma xenopodis TaxID=117903 RepID=A0A448X861_9PLAT|nr:unnamed protein product [Protopolystoma xenopodis]